MSISMILLARVVERKVKQGMSLAQALMAYSKLTESEKELVTKYVSHN